MTNGRGASHALLRRLARLYGIQNSYTDMEGRRVVATRDGLLAALKALGGVDGESDLEEALVNRERSQWDRRIEPVVIVWDGWLPSVELRMPASQAAGSIECVLTTEDGVSRRWDARLEELPVRKTHVAGRERFLSLGLPMDGTLQSGYHTLTVEMGGRALHSTVISAPVRAYSRGERKTWGVFLPLYAVHSRRSWGIGDLTDMQALTDWSAEQGASFIGTLPLLASFLDEPLDPSPYSPVSRLFWNELFIDPTRPVTPVRGVDGQTATHMQAEVARLNKTGLVDYAAVMSLKRRVLEAQTRAFHEASAEGEPLGRYLESKPSVAAYARFRAAQARMGPDWRAWPEEARRGLLTGGDYDDEVSRYYKYAQWTADTQMQALASQTRGKGMHLYLDLPVGVHPGGYDAWRYQDQFVDGMSVGAPPDIVRTSGQNWGFQPPHPDVMREQGYDYVRAYLRHHLSVAGMLRVDHAMGMHRLFCIPAGGSVRDGVYVIYRSEEQYALLSLESHRHESEIVGENLGLVPRAVNQGLSRHNVGKMYVMTIELRPELTPPISSVDKHTVASFGTHDLPTIGAFWRDEDLQQRLELGELTPDQLVIEKSERVAQKKALVRYLKQQGLLDDEDDLLEVSHACLEFLAATDADRVIVNLEEAWGETRPQNIPGTTGEQYPNWRLRAKYSLEELADASEVQSALDALRRHRGKRMSDHG